MLKISFTEQLLLFHMFPSQSFAKIHSSLKVIELFGPIPMLICESNVRELLLFRCFRLWCIRLFGIHLTCLIP